MSKLTAALTALWRGLKGTRTDAETVFDVMSTALNMKQRNQLREKLTYVQGAILIAERAEPDSWQVKEALKWVRGAFERLDVE